MDLTKEIPVKRRKLIPGLGRFSPEVTDYKRIYGSHWTEIPVGTHKLIPFLGRFSPELTTYDTRRITKFSALKVGPMDDGKFEPEHYDAPTFDEKKKLALEDAKNHRSFYRDLVKDGVYPSGTEINVKRDKNGAGFIILIRMPKIKSFKHNPEFPEKYIAERENIIEKMHQIEKKYGYGGLGCEDPIWIRNYGLQNGQLRYIDKHILGENGRLPCAKREADNIHRDYFYETFLAWRKNAPKQLGIGALEGKVITILATSFFIASIVFSSLSMTGSAISDSPNTSSSVIGLVLFLVGLSITLFRKTK